MLPPNSVTAVLVAISLLLVPAAAVSDHACACSSSWEVNAASLPVPLFVCPQGDTGSLLDQGWFISIDCREVGGAPYPNLPATDFWLVDENQDIVLCMGFLSSNADSATNAQGLTTMSQTTLVAGGCTDGLALVAAGLVLVESDCSTWMIKPISVRSPDLDRSLRVDLVDLSIFASHFPPGTYEKCCDFDINGVINLQDMAMFALHFGPPGHQCA